MMCSQYGLKKGATSKAKKEGVLTAGEVINRYSDEWYEASNDPIASGFKVKIISRKVAKNAKHTQNG